MNPDVEPGVPPRARPFDPDASYDFMIDADGDAVADSAFRIIFLATVPGIKRRQCTGSPAAMLPAAVEVGRWSYTMLPSLQLRNRESRFKEDWPFSLVIEAIRFSRTLVGRRNNFQWTGKDFLAGHNVSAIVPEVPNSALGSRPPVESGHACAFRMVKDNSSRRTVSDARSPTSYSIAETKRLKTCSTRANRPSINP